MGELSARDVEAMWQPLKEQLSLGIADSIPQQKVQNGVAAMDRMVQQAGIGELTAFEVQAMWQALKEQLSLDGASGVPESSSNKPPVRLRADFYCKDLGLSLRKAAILCGVSKSSVHRWIK